MSLAVGAVSLGYLLFGGYLIKRYDGIGVRGLGFFSLLWGGNFFLSATVILAFIEYGITDGVQLTQLQSSVPTSIQPLLASEALFSGLFSVGAIFAWLWFVLQYTRRIGRREKIAVAVIGGGTFLIAALNGLLGAAATFEVIRIEPAVRAGITEFATVVEILGTSVAIGVGTALLYVTATQHRPFRERAALGLVVPVLLPWLAGHLYQFGLVTAFGTISGLRTVTLAIGLGGLWLAVERDDIFRQLPASRAVGRQTAFNASDTAIVVVNNEGNVSDLNPAARDLFSVSSLDRIGEPLASLLPDEIDLAAVTTPEATTFELPNSDTVVEAVTTTATDGSGQPIGETLVFTDITAERRRQQRIQVLNRVLRHNLRNDLNAAKGYVNVMADGGTDTEQFRRKVESILDDLVTIGNKAQSTEQVLAADPQTNTPIPLSTLVDDAIDSVASTYDTVEPTVAVPETPAVRINPAVIEAVIEEVIENAARHTEATEIEIEYHPDRPSLSIADNGPGIPSHETAVLDNAKETDLEHGSGLGLWLIKWGTESFGGAVTFDTGPEGTAVRIDFPPELVVEVDAAES